ncbi:MAG: 50S ribosomal protein L6, partial [Gemmatimonadetes bacterium RIFCSPLOWO2_12_FULL_68_9]
MSRIGKRPVPIPAGVAVSVVGRDVTVKGPKGELKRLVHPEMSVAVEGT